MNDWTYAKARELLFYLVCHPSRSKEQIGLALWADASNAQLQNNFRVVLHHLRQALGQLGLGSLRGWKLRLQPIVALLD